MATSLYDQYHSEKNINHIYNLIDTLVKGKTDISIKNDLNNYNIYKNKLKKIFIESNNDTLEKLNRELILNNVQYSFQNYHFDILMQMLQMPWTKHMSRRLEKDCLMT